MNTPGTEVERDGAALRFADPAIQADREVVLAAVKQVRQIAF